MAKKTLTPLPKTVKETVDFIYEYLAEHPEGISLAMTSILDSRTQRKVASLLVKRGIIQKKAVAVEGRRGCIYKYKWAATMAPTKTLYGSIVSQIRNEDNNWPSHRKAEKSRPIVKEQPIVDEKMVGVEDMVEQKPIPIEPVSVFNGFEPLDGFSDQELWDELKKRGYSIEENRLVIVKKTYLD